MAANRLIASVSLTVVLAIVLSTSTAPVVVSATQTESTGVLVVDQSGEEGRYTSIQDAVDAASPGEIIEIRPGVYGESVSIGKDITLRGSPGVVLDGSEASEDVGIKLYAAPRISDVTIRGYEACVSGSGGGDWELTGVEIRDCHTGVRGAGSGNWMIRNSTISDTTTAIMASGSTGNWVVRDSRMEGNRRFGVRSTKSSGAWRVRDSTIRGSNFAVSASRSTGDWVITGTRLRDVSVGVSAAGADGSWVIAASTITNATQTGISAYDSEGAWSIRNTVVRTSGTGLGAYNSTGAWAVERSTLRGNDVAIIASSTSGDWRVENSTVRDSAIKGVRAEDSSGNWSVLNSVIRNTTTRGEGVRAAAEGVGIYAANTRGAWTVHGSTVTANAVHGIAAYGGERSGSATSNWWGDATGPTGEQCVGNVDCSKPLSRSSQQGSYRPSSSVRSTVTRSATTTTVATTPEPTPTEGDAGHVQRANANPGSGLPVDLSSPIVTFPIALVVLLIAIWYTE